MSCIDIPRREQILKGVLYDFVDTVELGRTVSRRQIGKVISPLEHQEDPGDE